MIYGWCGICGISPSEVDQMSIWEYLAIRDMWLISNGGTPAGDGDLDEDRLSAMGIEGFD